MTILYFSLFAIGVLFVIVTSVLGGGDAEIAADTHSVDVPLLSPTILAAFVTGFGGVGAILRITADLPILAEVALAAVGGLALAGVGLLLMGAITRQTQVGSEYATNDLVGASAEVITPIPAGGLGEVAYIKKGTRSNAPARSLDGQAIPRNSDVRIVSVSGTTLVVEPATSLP